MITDKQILKASKIIAILDLFGCSSSAASEFRHIYSRIKHDPDCEYAKKFTKYMKLIKQADKSAKKGWLENHDIFI